MKLAVEPFNLEHALNCIQNNIDAIIIGNNQFSVRNCYDYSTNEMINLIKNKNNTKIFIKVNAFFFENQLDDLTNYLSLISTWAIDGVIFSDFSVAQINDEKKLKLKLRYNPETLVTSYFQFPFFEENNFKCVSLAREISMFELNDILKNKSNHLELEIQGHGFLFIMHSRWKLISNFEKYYDINLKHEQLKIRENLRKLPNILIEDNHGTHMYSGYQIYTIDILDQIIDIDWLRIDCINMTKEEAFKITHYYQEAIIQLNQDLNAYRENVDKIYQKIESCSSSPISHSFLGKMQDILHMEKNNE